MFCYASTSSGSEVNATCTDRSHYHIAGNLAPGAAPVACQAVAQVSVNDTLSLPAHQDSAKLGSGDFFDASAGDEAVRLAQAGLTGVGRELESTVRGNLCGRHKL
jgi:hypothetical protein